MRTTVAAGLLVVLVAGCGANTTATSATTSATTSAATSATPTGTTSAAGATTPATMNAPGYPSGTQTISFDVGGTTRTAELAVPADLSHPAPLVFAFHGHGGSGKNFERKMGIEGLWPNAIVVYPDGLVGHSNGSAFVSLLLDERGEAIAATANLSAQPGKHLETDPVRSMFMSMGETDPIVPYENQRKSIPLAERKIGADPATKVVDGYFTTERGTGNHELCLLYTSPSPRD